MTFIKARKELIEGFWALMLPILILGGIYSGFFTPTEAAAVAVVYAWVAAAHPQRIDGEGPSCAYYREHADDGRAYCHHGYRLRIQRLLG